MGIQVILFDLGNVIIPVFSEKTYRYWSELSGISVERIGEAMNSGKETYFAFERGEISPRRFRKAVSGALGYRFRKKDFDRGWNLMIENIPEETRLLLGSLRRKYRLAVLSNTNRIHEKFFMKKFHGVFSVFDRIFLSHRIGGRKPDEAVFRKTLDHFGISPEEMVYFDDRIDFIQAAEKMGIRAVHVSKPSDIASGLRKNGVEI